jgi:hypothetical protein
VVTGIDKDAFERVGGKRSGGFEVTAWFNPSAGQAHDRFGNLPTTQQLASLSKSTTAGAASAACIGRQINYDPTRGDDGSLTEKITVESDGYGLEWGNVLTYSLLGGPGVTASLDFGAASAFGLQAYLQVLLVTGTSVTVAIQESSDNAVGDPFAAVAGGTFVAATGPSFQRIATSNALTVERYLRVSATGTFTAALFLVQVMRNSIAGQVF